MQGVTMISRLMMLVMALSVVGCMTTDPDTGEQKMNNTSKGAAIGAVAGAVLGAAVSHNNRGQGALVGAAIGGAAGAGGGYYMDNQEKKMRESLRNTDVQVERQGENLNLIMPGNVTFATNSADIRSDFYRDLNAVVDVVQEYNKSAITVTGHTDNVGVESRNQILSEQRAASVGDYLMSRGVSANRVQTRGVGSRYPMADNKTAAGRETNRRVEIQVKPI